MPEQQTRLLAARYELLSPIGRGTMGTVWRAHDRLLGRDVAVKEIRQDSGLSKEQRDELRERMIREGRAAAKIAHPSVATVHDAIVVDGSPWIIMELVEARSLEQVIEEEGPLPPRLVAEIGLDLMGALGAAHEQGILHRDVKPANVLLTETGRVVLTDFGIAKVEGDASITKTGMVIGSPGYTAPERARGDHTGPESDLWSLGATLYFAVEGRPAYERGSVSETLAALMTEHADPPRQAGPLRPALEALLEKDYTKRPGHAQALAMLRKVARTSGNGATPAEPAAPAKAGGDGTRTANATKAGGPATTAPRDTTPKPAKGTPPRKPGGSPGPAGTAAGTAKPGGTMGGTPKPDGTTGGTAEPGGTTGGAAGGAPTPGGAAVPVAAVQAGGESEIDPDKTMVVIRPKGGLRIPGVQQAGPSGDGRAAGAAPRPAAVASPSSPPARPQDKARIGADSEGTQVMPLPRPARPETGRPGADRQGPGLPGTARPGSPHPQGPGGTALPPPVASTGVRQSPPGSPAPQGRFPAPPVPQGAPPAPAYGSAPQGAAPQGVGPQGGAAAGERWPGREESGLGTDLFAFQGPAARRGRTPVGMVILLAIALIGLAAIVMLISAAVSDSGGSGHAAGPHQTRTVLAAPATDQGPSTLR
ncbi:serine/threonine-protein kinase [Sphaerisporangium fuscum]|uniref:serine/threonine-protein kinase n=1 Tax=Sphaerisporangium fuscum TaxID=2835868 RepID=UPI001BDC1262|nr:serine/threonine-protein kinase [Sphaerisporangium fuscum]